MSHRTLFLLALLLPSQLGCIWDRDTLASELSGREDIVKIIAGWFDRYPDQYYLMRLERVSKELESDPTNLGHYDDAAVASDRLGRPDAAIEWMEKKKSHLHLEAANAPQPNHHYRTLANLGTFHAHRWVKHRLAHPDESADLTELRTAESLIAEAIAENPDAHFGREKYQLMLIQWLLTDATTAGTSPNPLVRFLQNPSEHTSSNSSLADQGLSDLVEGISGLIELGAGWRSIDLFSILNLALLEEGDSRPAALAFWRAEQLATNGSTSLHPDINLAVFHYYPRGLDDSSRVKNYYLKITEAADQRHQARTAYLLTRLDRGEHPDTHPEFWKDWKEPRFPGVPLGTRLSDFFLSGIVGIVTLLCLPVILVYLISKYIRYRRTMQPA